MHATPGHWMVESHHRQIRTSLFVAALAVTFGIGLLTGLVALRTVGQGAPTAAHVGAVAAVTGGGTPGAARSRITADGQDIQLGTRFGSVTLPVAAPTAQQVGVRSRITADGQDIQLGTRFGSP